MISQRDEDRFDEGTEYVFSSLSLNWQIIHPQQNIKMQWVQILKAERLAKHCWFLVLMSLNIVRITEFTEIMLKSENLQLYINSLH